MMDMKVASDFPPGAGEAVHYLEDLLAEVIRYLDGEEAAALVKRAQDVAEGDDDEALEALFSGLRVDQAVYLARAFTCASMLLNLGEDVAGRRRAAEAPPGDIPATLVEAAGRVGARAPPPKQPNNKLKPLLNAHPNQKPPRAIVHRDNEI
jgi:phosphoenolpyruvate carboxylase